jgi:hypothetical protein
MTSKSNGVKPCVSLLHDAKAAEDASMVLEDHVEKIKERHGLSQRDLAPFRLVGNTLTNVSNSVKRNAKDLSPGEGDPEWVTKRKEKDRRLHQFTNGSTPPSQKTPVGSVELHNEEKENRGGRRTRSCPR